MSSSSQRPNAAATPRQVLNVQRGKTPVKAVGAFLPHLTRKAFEKFGFSTATLIMDWPVIVGGDIAQWTLPERLKWSRSAPVEGEPDGLNSQARAGATLVLRVDQARALDVQYKSRQIIERINAYFGYAAIAEIRMIQGPIERQDAPRRRPKPQAPLTREVSGIAHEPLRDALARLGASIRASS